MQAQYAPIVRRSAAITAVAAAIMVAISAAVGGGKGAICALLGVALVAVFYAISVTIVGRAARVSPQAMMIAAITTYLVKIVLLLFFVVRFSTTTAFNTRLFGLTALACILVWSAGQIYWSQRLKTLNVEPAREPQMVPPVRPDGEG
jgi:ATP synthase protein I